MSYLALACLFVSLVGFFLLPIGCWRIAAGAWSKHQRNQRVLSGMRMVSLGVVLLVTGVSCLAYFGPSDGSL